MKNWLKHLKVLGLILLLLAAVSLFVAADETVINPPVNKMEQKVEALTKDLNLDHAQVNLIRKILEMEAAQAKKDRDSFKTDAMKLVEAAKSRRESRNSKIALLLTDKQKTEFDKMRKPSAFDKELELWTEGLLLNDEQAFNVEGILIDYYNMIEEMRPEGMPMGEGPGSGGGMRRGGHHPGGFGMMADLSGKKERKIKKELDKEQKKLFIQIKEYFDKRAKEMKKRMKERRKELR